MKRLLSVEFRRYAARRTVRATGVLAFLAILIATVIVVINSDRSMAAVRDSARERQRLIAECEEAAQTHPVEFQNAGDCEGFFPRESFDPRFHLTALEDVLEGLSFLFVILAMGLGATFIGAEWNAGTVTTILTWEPRRVRILAAKVLAGASFVFVAVMTVQALLVAFMAPVALLRGSTAGVDGAWLGDVAEIAARSALIGALAAVIGMSVASIARNTAAALIVAFVYFAVIENVLRGVRPNWVRWLPGDNMALFVIGSEGTGIREISELRAFITVALYSTVFFIGALGVFRSRDVT
ncbi:MAG: ABC transporter permease subunit [Actinobacteria bacterium]|nr:ABC transporter permease subunit [Actinomycetota bacterium]